jgi:hypothetical protein
MAVSEQAKKSAEKAHRVRRALSAAAIPAAVAAITVAAGSVDDVGKVALAIAAAIVAAKR